MQFLTRPGTKTSLDHLVGASESKVGLSIPSAFAVPKLSYLGPPSL